MEVPRLLPSSPSTSNASTPSPLPAAPTAAASFSAPSGRPSMALLRLQTGHYQEPRLLPVQRMPPVDPHPVLLPPFLPRLDFCLAVSSLRPAPPFPTSAQPPARGRPGPITDSTPHPTHTTQQKQAQPTQARRPPATSAFPQTSTQPPGTQTQGPRTQGLHSPLPHTPAVPSASRHLATLTSLPAPSPRRPL